MNPKSPKTPQEPPAPSVATTTPPEARSPDACQPANDAEENLRSIWTEKGIPEDRQDELIADIAAKAAPGAMVGPFQILEDKRRADLEAPYYQLAGQTQPRPEGNQGDMFGAAGLDRKPAGNLRHGGGTLL